MHASPDDVLRYGDDADHIIEVWRDRGEPRAVILLLHGGFWKAQFDRVHLRPLAAALAQRGYAVLLPEFRRVGRRGGWPSTFDDVAAVSMFLDDPPWSELPVVVMGHSAGGHLALWLTATAPPERLAGVVALAPVADLVQAFDQDLGDGAVARLLDGSPSQVPERYAAADPTQLAAPPAPVAILHGTADPTVPIGLARHYAEGHDGVEVREIPCGHFELIDPDDPAFQEITNALDEVVETRKSS